MLNFLNLNFRHYEQKFGSVFMQIDHIFATVNSFSNTVDNKLVYF